ncbi:MAG: rRNA maturation RNase YbeY [Bacteroidia bacterium]|nr:rRNA maturation RNase YbeY [Bacteroidia bacterium]
MEQSLEFFSQEIEFTLDKEDSVRDWILFVIDSYDKKVSQINYIFCSDDYLLELNRTHLQHDYYTDILTFPYAPAGVEELISDIYISIDRVKDNAHSYELPFIDELHRVMIHGALHLIGFDDHGDAAKKEMSAKEDMALAQRKFL